MTTTDAQKARFERLFDTYDINKDGYLTLEDFTTHAYKLAEMRGLDKESPQLAALVDSLKGWWKNIEESADFDRDGKVTRDEFIDFAKGLASLLQGSVEAGEEWPLNGWIDSLYALIDADGDGKITLDEYRNWVSALGIADMDVEAAFKGFDKNSDGVLSRDEFADVSKQFWLHPDENTPGHRWLGP